jgi:hypothetical protein
MQHMTLAEPTRREDLRQRAGRNDVLLEPSRRFILLRQKVLGGQGAGPRCGDPGPGVWRRGFLSRIPRGKIVHDLPGLGRRKRRGASAAVPEKDRLHFGGSDTEPEIMAGDLEGHRVAFPLWRAGQETGPIPRGARPDPVRVRGTPSAGDEPAWHRREGRLEQGAGNLLGVHAAADVPRGREQHITAIGPHIEAGTDSTAARPQAGDALEVKVPSATAS